VDIVVFRNVIERHAVSNPLALRWIERQLLANPGGGFSVKKHYDALRAQGLSVAKDTLHALEAAVAEHRRAMAILVTMDAVPPSRPLPGRISWAPAARWLLEES
jgi:hypothetical protein